MSRRLQKIYYNMKNRCYRKENKDYYRYGGRGIHICDEWLNNSKLFYEWALKNGYKDNLTIDRIDNNGNYEPNNCRWVTIEENNNNTRRNRYITYNCQTKSISQWAKYTGIGRQTLYDRLNNSWPIDESFFRPPELHDLDTLTINGETKIISEWAKEHNLNPRTLRSRINEYNYPIDRLFEQPRRRNGSVIYITINGITKTTAEWSKESGLSNGVILHRFYNNWNENDLLSPLMDRGKKYKNKTHEY